jgi:HEAT repeat protein
MSSLPQPSLRARQLGAANSKRAQQLRLVLLLLPLALFSTLAGFEVARFQGASHWSSTDSVQAASLGEIPVGTTSDVNDLSLLPPQEQAERLLDRAIGRDRESLEQITNSVDSWRGHIENTDHLYDLIHQALNSGDLRVRAAAVEIDLAANNLSKSPETVSRLVQKLRDDPAERPWTLWQLGALGNRGVQPEIVLAQLRNYAHDRNEQTRYWAVEGLAILGTDDVIDPLLDRFAHDLSSRVRQRAACNLAESGMLTREQRLTAIPDLLNFFDDDGMDSATRGWVYGALRMITGEELGNDANAWRKWWAQRDANEKQAHLHTGILFA